MTNRAPIFWQLECDGRVIVPLVKEACGFLGRTVGLIGRRNLPPGEGLWLEPCGAIHTAFLRFPIDVIFLASDGRVVSFAPNVRPWRCKWGGPLASIVVEVSSGWLDPDTIRLGLFFRRKLVSSAGAGVLAQPPRRLE